MNGAAGVRVRAATSADHPAIIAIGLANDEPLELPAGSSANYLDHLAARGRMLVADVDGAVAGFSAAIDLTDGSRHLTDLFVVPNLHGRGIGRALLGATLGGSFARTTFASADPRALPLYVRAGMGAYWPLLYLDLDGPTLARLDEATGDTLRVDRVDGAAAAAAEEVLAGCDRAPDYPVWMGRAGAIAMVIRVAGGPVAVGLAGATEEPGQIRLLRAAVSPAADADRALVALVLAMTGRRSAGSAPWAVPASAQVAIPGPHPALAPLLAAGARITGRDTFMASDPRLVDPRTTVPDPALR